MLSEMLPANAAAAAAAAAVCMQLKHPLLVELMGCFAALLKEYKGEVEDILVADKQVRGDCMLPNNGEDVKGWSGVGWDGAPSLHV